MPGVGAQQKSQKLGRSLLQPERARRVALRVENSLFLINAAFEVEHHGAIFAFAAPWVGNMAGVDALHEFYGSRSLTIRLNDAFFGHHPVPLRNQCTRSTETCQGQAGIFTAILRRALRLLWISGLHSCIQERWACGWRQL